MNSEAADTSVLTCTDWRGWSSHRIAPLLQRETERWMRDFHWDQRWSFTHVEAAREAGRLPGLVVTGADGAARGWTFFLRHGRQFQIGTIVSDSAAATRALIGGALASPLADDADVVLFAPSAPDLEPVLHAHQIATEAYDYLVMPAGSLDSAAADAPRAGRPFSAHDLVPVAVLVGESYRHTTFLRPFVPSGDPSEWRDYLSQLVATRGCGEFLADASVVVDEAGRTDDPDAIAPIRGALLATRLSADTGHIAQLMVSPHARGGGEARRMLSTSLARLRAHGLGRVSLLVARTNTPARRLYDSFGFQSTGSFLTGIR